VLHLLLLLLLLAAGPFDALPQQLSYQAQLQTQ
jgi:hypothetical protein